MLVILILQKYIQRELHGKIKKLVKNLSYDGIEFRVREKDIRKIEKKNNICFIVFRYENKLTFPIYISDQKFENSMDSLLLTDYDKSQYVHISVEGVSVQEC